MRLSSHIEREPGPEPELSLGARLARDLQLAASSLQPKARASTSAAVHLYDSGMVLIVGLSHMRVWANGEQSGLRLHAIRLQEGVS